MTIGTVLIHPLKLTENQDAPMNFIKFSLEIDKKSLSRNLLFLRDWRRKYIKFLEFCPRHKFYFLKG